MEISLKRKFGLSKVVSRAWGGVNEPKVGNPVT